MSTAGRGGPSESQSALQSVFFDTPMGEVSTETPILTRLGATPSNRFYARFYAGPKDLHLLVFKHISVNDDAGHHLAKLMGVNKQWRSLLIGPPPPYPAPKYNSPSSLGHSGGGLP